MEVDEVGRELGDDLEEDHLRSRGSRDAFEGDLADERGGDAEDVVRELDVDESHELRIKVDETEDVLEESWPQRDREESKDRDGS